MLKHVWATGSLSIDPSSLSYKGLSLNSSIGILKEPFLKKNFKFL